MRGFLFGAYCMASVWAWYEWRRNPHGHRGGQEIPKPVRWEHPLDIIFPEHAPHGVSLGSPKTGTYSLPVRYHRTG